MKRAESKTRVIWWIVVAVFTCISLWPIWSVRLPPLQDYPQHLLQAYMFTHRHDPRFDFSRHFTFHLQPVYSTFFVATISLSKLLPIETAGKVALSLYIAMVAGLIIWLARRDDDEEPPWGLLLLFPFALNQQYFQGNINYCYSLPLLLFALLDQEELMRQPLSAKSIGRLLFWQVALLVTHPLTFLIYLGLAALRLVHSSRRRDRSPRAVAAPLTAACLFVTCVVAEKLIGGAVFARGTADTVWKPWGETLGYYCYIFTGMRWHDGVDSCTVVFWLVIAAVAVISICSQNRGDDLFSDVLLTPCLIVTAAVVLLPFAWHGYTYVNFRLSVASYFFLAALAGCIQFRGIRAALLVLCIAVLLLQSAAKQNRLSKELEEALPIVERIPPNARILPLVFDRISPELDPVYFDPYIHVHDYYHLLVGGGIDPYIWAAGIQPLRLRPGVHLPNPGEITPGMFSWEQHADGYEYFLVRGAPLLFTLYVSGQTDPIAKSGAWLLLKRRHS